MISLLDADMFCLGPQQTHDFKTLIHLSLSLEAFTQSSVGCLQMVSPVKESSEQPTF